MKWRGGRGFDPLLRMREGIAFAAGEDEIGAGARESSGENLSQSAAGAGHDSNSSGQIEEAWLWRLFVHDGVPGVSTTFIRFGSRA